MCHASDARPPDVPADLSRIPPIAGGALDSERLILAASDGNRLAAFLARAPQPSGSAVVIFPDNRGLGTFYEELALRFAEVGHDAIAFDYFGRTAGTEPRAPGWDPAPHRQQVSAETVAADARAAAQRLRAAVGEGLASLFTVGFCFGGRHSLLQSVDGSSTAPDGVIAFYGVLASRPPEPGPLDRVDEMRAPVLALFGGEDQAIPRAQIDELDAGLTRRRVDHEIHVYPRATHSFFDRRAAEFRDEADDAWHRVVGWIAAHSQVSGTP